MTLRHGGPRAAHHTTAGGPWQPTAHCAAHPSDIGMKKGKQIRITDDEVQSAIRRFVQDGGIIRKLPAQKAVGARQIGKRWNTSEISGDLN
ncbi:MAG: hypothetical protein GWO03_09700 [Gammaproteobacteria bacterium]|nr:hypothetical protein [Gammaproteobacteria bacterium]